MVDGVPWVAMFLLNWVVSEVVGLKILGMDALSGPGMRVEAVNKVLGLRGITGIHCYVRRNILKEAEFINETKGRNGE